MMKISRRKMLVNSGLSLSMLSLPRIGWSSSPDEPHFFISYFLRGGWDPSYLFDARPLEMHASGTMQNYLGETPNKWTGLNGEELLATSIVSPLKPYFDAQKISMLNGVYMTTAFDGHEQNMNIFLTGNPFGGNTFLPYLNSTALPLDALQFGNLYNINITNGEKIVSISSNSVNQLALDAENMLSNQPNPVLQEYILSRFNTLATTGNSSMAKGSRSVLDSYTKIGTFRERLATAKIDEEENPLKSNVKAACKYFETGLTRNALLIDDDGNLDTHDSESAKNAPTLYRDKVSKILLFIQTLENTEYKNSGKSFLDYTTFMITSEFGRTLKQWEADPNNSGTDHNTLSNSIILGGKKIKGGMVVGSSDFRSSNEELSNTHLKLDENRLKTIGKPFDFDTLRSRSDFPETYKEEDFLNYSSVANTLFKAFGIHDDKLHWEVKRNGPKARSINNLLV